MTAIDDFLNYCQDGDISEVKRLVEERPELATAVDGDGWTGLMCAADGGHTEICAYLISQGANVNTTNVSFRSDALQLASDKGHTDVVNLLIAHGANVNYARTSDGWTALMFATKHNFVECVRSIVNAKADVNIQNRENFSNALMIASDANFVEEFDILVEAKADVSAARYKDGWTALQFACHKGFPDIVSRLVKLGARLDDFNYTNLTTALMLAADNCHIDCMRLVVEAGADVKYKQDKFVTALHYLLNNRGSHDIEKIIEGSAILLKAGADPNARRLNDGFTPFYIAISRTNAELVKLMVEHGGDLKGRLRDKDLKPDYSPLIDTIAFQDIESTRALLEAKADVNEYCFGPNTFPLRQAVSCGIEMVKLVLEFQADVNQVTEQHSYSAVMEAAMCDDGAAVDLLAQHGANLDLVNNEYNTTALQMAVYKEHPSASQALINNKANLDYARRTDGWTPLMFVAENGNAEIARALIQGKCDVNAVNHTYCSTALMLAADNNKFTVISEILESPDVKVNQQRVTDGYNALHFAAGKGYLETATRIIEHPKVDMTVETFSQMETALAIAISQRKARVVHALLVAKVDVNQLSSTSRATALMLASKSGMPSVVKAIVTNNPAVILDELEEEDDDVDDMRYGLTDDSDDDDVDMYDEDDEDDEDDHDVDAPDGELIEVDEGELGGGVVGFL